MYKEHGGKFKGKVQILLGTFVDEGEQRCTDSKEITTGFLNAILRGELTTMARPMMELGPVKEITLSVMFTLTLPSGPASTLPRSPMCLKTGKGKHPGEMAIQ